MKVENISWRIDVFQTNHIPHNGKKNVHQTLLQSNAVSHWLGANLESVSVSGVIEHIELDKGLDMVDKAGVGGKKMNKSEMTH